MPGHLSSGGGDQLMVSGGGVHGGSANRRDAGDNGGGRAGRQGECAWGGGTDVKAGAGAGDVGKSGFDPTRDKEELAAVIISQFSPQVWFFFFSCGNYLNFRPRSGVLVFDPTRPPFCLPPLPRCRSRTPRTRWRKLKLLNLPNLLNHFK